MLVIIPDGTRTAPIPLLFRLLYEQIGRRVARLDYLIALGTHPPMSEEAIEQLVGVDGGRARGTLSQRDASSTTTGMIQQRCRPSAPSRAQRPHN